ncbi:DUF3105 domain-containing protein [Rhodococcus sp. CX]|nr:DUF3105 domain-containing protein [Rhodococcus sp. CX]
MTVVRRSFAVAVGAVVAIALAGCGSESDGNGSGADTVADPSVDIPGIEIVDYPAGDHVGASERVPYEYSPPFGGPHDAAWATCTGIVYPVPIRSENAVHSLEHGAVWITYDPERLSDEQVDLLAARVDGVSYMLMSPYPDLAQPISLQSWGHRLFVEDADDPRIDQFIEALRLNPNTYPEPGATCATLPTNFDPANPPPFQPIP